ncbi:Os08g0410950, partial [Oryza sativa Japonica Group]
ITFPQIDKEDRVQNIFRVDGAARKAYKDYKDYISFDYTYMTNMYNMPCAPFIRINRYGQSI